MVGEALTLVKLRDEVVSDLLQHSRVNRKELLQSLNFLEKVLRHIGHRTYVWVSAQVHKFVYKTNQTNAYANNKPRRSAPDT